MLRIFAPRVAWLVLFALGACAVDRGGRGPLLDGSGGLCSECGACEETLPVTSALHVTGMVDYPDVPPVGGPHSACWGTWGVHDEPLKTERWVHNLEHGGVVFLYRCDEGCDAEIASLKGRVAAHDRTILTQYDALPKRFAALAWGWRLVSDCLDLTAFEAFYEEHYDRGPESISTAPPVQCAEFPDL